MIIRHNTAVWLFTVCFSLVTAACVPAKETAQPKLQTAEMVIVNGDGKDVRITVEIARTAKEQSMGLMFRKKLEDGEGMLFV
jgi:hypothetical protein